MVAFHTDSKEAKRYDLVELDLIIDMPYLLPIQHPLDELVVLTRQYASQGVEHKPVLKYQCYRLDVEPFASPIP